MVERPVYVYDIKRDISFNFKVYPTSREMKPIWKKLERLSTYTSDYTSNGYTAG